MYGCGGHLGHVTQIHPLNSLTLPKFELVRDFIPVMDTCKFEEVAAMPRTRCQIWAFKHSRASNSKMNCTIWLKLGHIRAFKPALV